MKTLSLQFAQEATEYASSPRGLLAGQLVQITLLLSLALLLVVPTMMALIFKSEAKQAKSRLQLRRYKEDLVQVNLAEEPKPENNFKLICGTGNVVSKEPLIDDFFSLKVRNTLRLRRTVEVYDRRAKRRKGEDTGCPCGGKDSRDISSTEANSRLTWVQVRDDNVLRSKTFHAGETYVVGQHQVSEHDIPGTRYRLDKR